MVKKKRGPGYPGVSLPKAIERMRPVVNAEPHNEMSAKSAAIHLGYKGVSGASLTMIADMRRYGLLDGRGDQIKVSRDALTIITDENNDDQSERIEALNRCATNDSLFSNIASYYKDIPAPATLRSYLIKSGFNSESAEEATFNYTETMEFVIEQDKEYTPNDEGDDKPPQDSNKKHRLPGMTDYKLPLSTDTWAILSAPFPLDDAAWNQMLAVLNVMKPGLVSKNKHNEGEENSETAGDNS